MREIPDLIPNFFYDLICRIVPGGLVLFLYFRDWFVLEQSFFKATCIALASWAVGMTLDQVTGLLGHIRDCLHKNDPISVYYLDSGRRTSIVRAMADVAFFRVMAVISALVVMSGFFLVPEIKGITDGYRVLAIFGFLFSVACWLKRTRERRAEQEEAKEYLADKNTPVIVRMERESKWKSTGREKEDSP